MTLINIKPTHLEPMRSEDPSEQGPHIPPLVRKDVHPQGFEFYKQGFDFFFQTTHLVCVLQQDRLHVIFIVVRVIIVRVLFHYFLSIIFITSHHYFNVILIVLRIIVVRILVAYCLSIISILHQKGSEAIFIPLKCLHFHNHKT